jgi:hypothetical protein
VLSLARQLRHRVSETVPSASTHREQELKLLPAKVGLQVFKHPQYLNRTASVDQTGKDRQLLGRLIAVLWNKHPACSRRWPRPSSVETRPQFDKCRVRVPPRRSSMRKGVAFGSLGRGKAEETLPSAKKLFTPHASLVAPRTVPRSCSSRSGLQWFLFSRQRRTLAERANGLRNREPLE